MEAEGDTLVWDAAQRAEDFFMGRGAVNEALKAVTEALEAAHIPYAVMGAMALNRYGHERVTVGVDIVVTADGLARFKAAALGKGYVEKFQGSKGVRDTVHNVASISSSPATTPETESQSPFGFPTRQLNLRGSESCGSSRCIGSSN